MSTTIPGFSHGCWESNSSPLCPTLPTERLPQHPTLFLSSVIASTLLFWCHKEMHKVELQQLVSQGAHLVRPGGRTVTSRVQCTHLHPRAALELSLASQHEKEEGDGLTRLHFLAVPKTSVKRSVVAVTQGKGVDAQMPRVDLGRDRQKPWDRTLWRESSSSKYNNPKC